MVSDRTKHSCWKRPIEKHFCPIVFHACCEKGSNSAGSHSGIDQHGPKIKNFHPIWSLHQPRKVASPANVSLCAVLYLPAHTKMWKLPDLTWQENSPFGKVQYSLWKKTFLFTEQILKINSIWIVILFIVLKHETRTFSLSFTYLAEKCELFWSEYRSKWDRSRWEQSSIEMAIWRRVMQLSFLKCHWFFVN